MSIEFVICGLEHSGTTLVSDLFRQVDGLDAGFEVGLLLCEKPAEFHEFNPFAQQMLVGWGISEQQFRACCDAPTHGEFYARLKAVSGVIPPGTSRIFDKTPRYLSRLGECLERTDVPFIVIYKDPRAVVHSDFKRAGTQDFDGWYRDYMPKKRHYLRSCYQQYISAREGSERVAVISLEELAMNARSSMEYIFDHVNIAFSLDYMMLKELRYKNTRSNSVSIPIAFSYVADFDQDRQARIEKDFKEFDHWFYR